MVLSQAVPASVIEPRPPSGLANMDFALERPNEARPLDRYLLLVDVETGGADRTNCGNLGADKYALLEIGCLAVNVFDLLEVSSWDCLIKPPEHLLIEEEALKINKLSRSLIEAGLKESEALRRMQAWVQAYRNGPTFPPIVGWNVNFDVSFLQAAFFRSKMKWPFSYRTLDIQDLWAYAHIIQDHDMAYSGITEAIRTMLKKTPAHSAIEDCRDELELLRMFSK